jgi:hypothetical protein
VTRAQTVAKLEALLERVRARAFGPRFPGAAGPLVPAAAASPPTPLSVSGVSAPLDAPSAVASAAVPAPPPVAAVPMAPAAPAPVAVPLAAAAQPVAAAPSVSGAPHLALAPSEAYAEAPTLEAEEGEISVDIDLSDEDEDAMAKAPAESADEAPVSEDFDSRERLVAAQPVPVDPPPAPEASAGPIHVAESGAGGASDGMTDGEERRDGVGMSSSPPMDVTDMEVLAEDEEAPVSSRRAVAAEPEERLARMAFGTDEPPPLHTPPPESGQLPAAPSEFDFDITGVRSAKPLPPLHTEPPEALADSAEPAAAREPSPLREPLPPRELVPEVTRAEPAPSETVADWVDEAQAFAPPSFVALLDASLSL